MMAMDLDSSFEDKCTFVRILKETEKHIDELQLRKLLSAAV